VIILKDLCDKKAEEWWELFEEYLKPKASIGKELMLSAMKRTDLRQNERPSLKFFNLLDPIREGVSDISFFWKDAQDVFRKLAEIHERVEALNRVGVHEAKEEDLKTLFGDLLDNPLWQEEEEEELTDSEKRLVALVDNELGELVSKDKLDSFKKKLLFQNDLESHGHE